MYISIKKIKNRLFLFAILVSLASSCDGQRSISFKAIDAVQDSVGIWLRFSKTFDINSDGKDFTPNTNVDHRVIANRLLYIYHHSSIAQSGQYFDLDLVISPNAHNGIGKNFVPRYGGFIDGYLGIRLENRQNGAYKVLIFQKSDERWRTFETESDLSYYLQNISYMVHGKLHAARNKRNYALNQLQTECLEYRYPLLLSLQCLVKQLKDLSALDRTKLKMALGQLDAVSYQ